jgi:hypothetical protein
MVILSILENIMYYAMLFKDTVTAATQKAPGHKSRGSSFGDPGQNRTGDLPLRSSINQSLSLYNFITIKQLKALI